MIESMDLVTSCRVKLQYFRIKELKDVLAQLHVARQGKKQDLVDRILILVSVDPGAHGWGRRNFLGKEAVAKIIDDTYRKNNNCHNTCPARNDEGVLENELITATTRQQNSWNLTQNNNENHTNTARNGEGVLDNEPTTATTGQQNSWNLTQNNNEDHTNTARNYGTTLPPEQVLLYDLHMIIRASAGPLATGEFPRPQVAGEFPGHRPTLHGAGELPLYWTASMMERRDNEPTTAMTRQQNLLLTLVFQLVQRTLNWNRQYDGTILPLYMIGPQITGAFPRPQVAGEFPSQHVARELALYRTASRQGIARTASRLGISTLYELARAVGNLVLWWGTTVMLSGLVSTLQVEDLVFIALICSVLYIRINYLSITNGHSCRLFFATTCGVSGVLSTIRQASQHFGETIEAMEVRNLASNVFYGMALADALVNLALIAYYYVRLMIRPFDNESQE